MKWGIPSEWASERAERTASGEQHALVPSVWGSAQSLTVIATGSPPPSRSIKAATALSTPPERATPTRPGEGSASGMPADAIEERARWSASQASTTACLVPLPGEPSALSRTSGPSLAASRNVPPSTISARAAADAVAAAQPSASQVTSTTSNPSPGSRETRIRSPQAEPPAAPENDPSGGSARRDASSRYSR